jgi:hypothetical protein
MSAALVNPNRAAFCRDVILSIHGGNGKSLSGPVLLAVDEGNWGFAASSEYQFEDMPGDEILSSIRPGGVFQMDFSGWPASPIIDLGSAGDP